MSGSNRSTWDDVDTRGPDSCSTLQIRTQLGSPNHTVVSTLSKGILLDIAVERRGSATVVVALHKGQVAGGIASPEISRLRECIEGGTIYQSEIESINGGQVRIRIFAV